MANYSMQSFGFRTFLSLSFSAEKTFQVEFQLHQMGNPSPSKTGFVL